MSSFGKNHYIKFCITTYSEQKMAEGEYYGLVQVSKITIMSCVSCVLCLCIYNFLCHIF